MYSYMLTHPLLLYLYALSGRKRCGVAEGVLITTTFCGICLL